MRRPLLTYDHVEIGYNGEVAVKDVSFTLAAGEILGIVGESGSGKSTLVKAAMGLLGPDGMVTRGDIRYGGVGSDPASCGEPAGCGEPVGCGETSSQLSGDLASAATSGIDLLALSRKQLRALCGPEIGMVFQDCLASFTPILRIGVQVYESMAAHQKVTREESDRRAIEMLERLSFSDPARVLASYPFELSGGMGQRVGIALAMLLRPKVLIADEPTSALDVVSQKQVIDELLALRESYGTALIVVTHNIGIIRAMNDSVLVLHDGSAEDYGSTARVLAHPESAYTRRLIDAAPRLREVHA